MRKPTQNPVTQTARQHNYPATDYSFQPDEWVYAPETGTITDVTLNAGDCGKRIILKSGTTEYYMCHFQDVAVKVGQKVAEGQKLGIMGETGKAYGRHLHLVIMVNGVRVADPDKWLNERIGGSMGKISQAEVGKAYQLDGRKASAADKILHSSKGTVDSVLSGLIRDSAKAGNVKKINDLTTKNKALTAENTSLKAQIVAKDKRIKELEAGSNDQFVQATVYIKK